MPATTTEGRIFALLMGHLGRFPGNRPVVWPNTVYPPQGGVKAPVFLVVGYSPNVPLRVSIDPHDEHQHRGLLDVAVMTPLQAGGQEGQDVAGALAGYFTAVTLRDDPVVLEVVRRPHVAGSYPDGDRWRTPVVVEFRTVSV